MAAGRGQKAPSLLPSRSEQLRAVLLNGLAGAQRGAGRCGVPAGWPLAAFCVCERGRSPPAASEQAEVPERPMGKRKKEEGAAAADASDGSPDGATDDQPQPAKQQKSAAAAPSTATANTTAPVNATAAAKPKLPRPGARHGLELLPSLTACCLPSGGKAASASPAAPCLPPVAEGKHMCPRCSSEDTKVRRAAALCTALCACRAMLA